MPSSEGADWERINQQGRFRGSSKGTGLWIRDRIIRNNRQLVPTSLNRAQKVWLVLFDEICLSMPLISSPTRCAMNASVIARETRQSAEPSVSLAWILLRCSDTICAPRSSSKRMAPNTEKGAVGDDGEEKRSRRQRKKGGRDATASDGLEEERTACKFFTAACTTCRTRT